MWVGEAEAEERGADGVAGAVRAGLSAGARGTGRRTGGDRRTQPPQQTTQGHHQGSHTIKAWNENLILWINRVTIRDD